MILWEWTRMVISQPTYRYKRHKIAKIIDPAAPIHAMTFLLETTVVIAGRRVT